MGLESLTEAVVECRCSHALGGGARVLGVRMGEDVAEVDFVDLELKHACVEEAGSGDGADLPKEIAALDVERGEQRRCDGTEAN